MTPNILNVIRVALERADMNYRATGFKPFEIDAAKAWVKEVTTQPSPTAKAAPAQQITDYTMLGAAMCAIRQSISMIGEPKDERMRAVRRCLRGAVIVVEDSGELTAPAAGAVAGPSDDEILNRTGSPYAPGTREYDLDLIRWYRERIAAAPTPPAQAADSVLEDAALPEAVIDAVAASLGDAYDCGRVWSAWSYGTMGPDDFSMVAEDGDRVAEIATAAIEAYRAAMAAKKGYTHE